MRAFSKFLSLPSAYGKKAFVSCPLVQLKGARQLFCLGHRLIHSSPVTLTQEALQDGSIPRLDWFAQGEDGEPPATPRARACAEEILKLSMGEITQLQALYRARIGLTKDDIESLFGVGALPMQAGGAPVGAVEEAAPVEAKTSFDIKITGYDSKAKIKVIKEVRAITGLGLKEAKELVENVPKKIKEGIPQKEVDEIVEKLKAIGAEFEIE